MFARVACGNRSRRTRRGFNGGRWYDHRTRIHPLAKLTLALRRLAAGTGEIHRVIKADVHEVITWSEPSPEENKPGHSWLGDAEEFCKQFGPVQ